MFNSAEYRSRPFPLEAVRDLLGSARAVLEHWRVGADPDEGAVAALEVVQELLHRAVQLGHHQPGSMGHAAGWRRAERAAQALTRCAANDRALAEVVWHAVGPLRPAKGAKGRLVSKDPWRR